MELWGIVPCINQVFEKSIQDPSTMDVKNPLVVALGTCHSLTRIDGKLSGDPLDYSIFTALDWVRLFLINSKIPLIIGVLKEKNGVFRKLKLRP